MDIKQVIVVRKDLKMGKGKLAVEVAHASCEAVFIILESQNETWLEWLRVWRSQGQMKVVLKVSNEKELLEIFSKAKEFKLPVALVIDAGRTQLPPGTKTAVAIGPAPSNIIDKITGSLKLY
jgi:PTH2 family peptidyl-tRNA hydrolase